MSYFTACKSYNNFLYLIDSRDDCHSGVIVNDVCYFLGTNNLTWIGAETTCAQNGGHLATVKDSSVQDALQTLLRTNRQPTAWIGASEQTGLWAWLNGKNTKTVLHVRLAQIKAVFVIIMTHIMKRQKN